MKRSIKRKMYQKRRKKDKCNQRKNLGIFSESYKHNKYQIKLHEGSLNNNTQQQHFASTPIISYSLGLQMWWQTYCSAIQFHLEQHNNINFVKSDENRSLLLQKYANEYETSSDEGETNESGEQCDKNGCDIGKSSKEYMDEEYIKFLEITYKHQEELRVQKAFQKVYTDQI